MWSGGNDGSCADLGICLFQSFFFFKGKNKVFHTLYAIQKKKKSHTAWVKHQRNNPTVGPRHSLERPLHPAVGKEGCAFSKSNAKIHHVAPRRPLLSAARVYARLFSPASHRRKKAGWPLLSFHQGSGACSLDPFKGHPTH